jgi:WD40 repeat protein
MTLTPAGTLLTGSYDGRVLYWSDAKSGAQPLPGFEHSNQVTSFSVHPDGSAVYSAGMDDTVKRASLKDSKVLEGPVDVTTVEGIPKMIAVSPISGLLAAITSKGDILLQKNGDTLCTTKCDGNPSALAWSTTGEELSVGFGVRISLSKFWLPTKPWAIIRTAR